MNAAQIEECREAVLFDVAGCASGLNASERGDLVDDEVAACCHRMRVEPSDQERAALIVWILNRLLRV